MRVFVTGASGFVGSAVVKELLAAGHQVLGLARSAASAAAVTAAGAEVLEGSLEDLDILQKGARETDGIIHTGFIHDFSNFLASCEVDRRAIEAMGQVLAGTNKPLVVTSGIGLLAPGGAPRTEDSDAISASPRAGSEVATLALAKQGVRATIVRLPPTVHDAGDHGFIPIIINADRQHGVAAYIGDGTNRWPAVHRLDAARAFRLALEKGTAGARYHAIAEDGIPTRQIAETIGQELGLPVVSQSKEEAGAHFGFMSHFFSLDIAATSLQTQEQLGWTYNGLGLLEDMKANYFGK